MTLRRASEHASLDRGAKITQVIPSNSQNLVSEYGAKWQRVIPATVTVSWTPAAVPELANELLHFP